MSEIFATDRLTVRRFLPGDAADLAEILTDPEVTYFEPYETFTAEECIKEVVHFSRSEEFFAVVLGEKVIGKLYFSARDHGTYELGYTFHAGYQGHGYACESAKALMRYAFTEMGVRRIIAEINMRNERSLRLAERLGMRREAVHKERYPAKGNPDVYEDFAVYAMLRSELCSELPAL